MYLPQAGPDTLWLNQLASRELALNTSVNAVKHTAAKDTVGEINRQLQEQGVFTAYRQIHCEYVALSSFKRARVIRNEALKRALFLSWYSEVEPASFTGLADLDEDKIMEMYFVLNKVLDKGWMNVELEWMLRHYMQWEWIVLQYTENKLNLLTKWAKSLQETPVVLPGIQLPPGSMDKRGLMGLYFKEQGVICQ